MKAQRDAVMRNLIRYIVYSIGFPFGLIGQLLGFEDTPPER
jgi:hypothetical protein